MNNINSENSIIPQYVFIVPYRNREPHKQFFNVYMKYLLEDINPDNYKIIISHQCDKRHFNCGGMKNIGFLYVKELYPEYYKDITFIFNDIDTLPYKKNLLNYSTIKGEIKHYYGYNFALGGIVSIKGEDFENINGFPNYWGYGYEDNILYKRAIKNNLTVNRKQFYPIGSIDILQFYDGIKKVMNKHNINRQLNKSHVETDGLNTLTDINYKYDEETNMLNIYNFNGLYNNDEFDTHIHSLTNGKKVKVTQLNKMIFHR